MFKSIQWKLVTMFVLLVVSVMIIVGTFLLIRVADFYHNDFKNKMDSVFFGEDFATADVNPQLLEEKLKSFIGRLGIDSYRNYFILNQLGEVIKDSNSEIAQQIDTSPNIISAINGKKGVQVERYRQYIDYAIPVLVNNSTEYIIYIRDEKIDLSNMMQQMYTIIFNALLFGLIISIILGFIFSKTITRPIAILTKKSEEIAKGNFDQEIEIKSDDEIGKLTEMFMFMTNELKQNLDEIANAKNKVETILLYMTDGVMAFNIDGKLTHSNPAANRMLRIDDQDKISFNNFFPEIGLNIEIGHFINLNNWDTLEKEIEFNGMHIKAFFVAFKTDKANVGGVVVVLQDFTEQQKLDLARREFVANVSHELRTPLTSVKSYTETLLEGTVDDKKLLLQFLNVINNECDRMTSLVKDLLVLSQLEYKQTRWNKKVFSFQKLSEDVVEKLHLSAKERGHQLNIILKDKIPKIYGDSYRIEQVIKNIISNAIKYTPKKGKIDVILKHTDGRVYINIKDNGIGIPKEDLPRIFERFYRVDKARTRSLGGTGLGLAIAKEIISAHEGTINIESEQDKGTEVVISFPSAR